MKNIFIIIFSISIFLYQPIQAQKIIHDNYLDNGIRALTIDSKEFKIDNAYYSISLGVLSGTDLKKYVITIYSFWHMDSNTKVMIKLGNNETIELYSFHSTVNKIDWPTNNLILTNMLNSNYITTEKVDYYSSAYLIDSNLLEQMISKNIIKFRISHFGGYKEQNFNNSKLKNYFKKCSLRIEEKLKVPKSFDNSFENGF